MSTGDVAAVTPSLNRTSRLLVLAGLALALPATAADLKDAPSAGRFAAVCEDLGRLCFAEACGRDQIDAALGCRALCPSSVVLRVEPAACAIPNARTILRRRG